MKTEKSVNHVKHALLYAINELGTWNVITPHGMTAFNKAIKDYVRHEIWGNRPFRTVNWGKGEDDKVFDAAYTYILDKINEARQASDYLEEYQGLDSQTAVAHYGPWVVDKDGTVDHGGNEVYYHKPTWHEDEHHLSHMLSKVWVQDTAGDYLRALAHSAKIQGVKSFTVNVERITTEK